MPTAFLWAGFYKLFLSNLQQTYHEGEILESCRPPAAVSSHGDPLVGDVLNDFIPAPKGDGCDRMNKGSRMTRNKSVGIRISHWSSRLILYNTPFLPMISSPCSSILLQPRRKNNQPHGLLKRRNRWISRWMKSWSILDPTRTSLVWSRRNLKKPDPFLDGFINYGIALDVPGN